MRNIITFHGISNVGKTTLAKHLTRRVGAYYTTPINRWKRFLENVYGFEPYSLDTQAGKKQTIGNTTAGQLLRDSFHFWEERDPGFGARCLDADLTDNGDLYQNVIVESIRFPVEVSYIKGHAELCDARIIVFDVSSSRGIKHSTDHRQGMCLQHYGNSTPIIRINNDFDLQTVLDEVDNWYLSQARTDRLELVEQLRLKDD